MELRPELFVGFWRSRPENDHDDLPWPGDMVDHRWDLKIKDTVIEHLKDGRRCNCYMGHSMCRFCGSVVGACTVTDGIYRWPEGLEHYLEEHCVRLPEKFVEHVLKDREISEEFRYKYDKVSEALDNNYWGISISNAATVDFSDDIDVLIDKVKLLE